MEDLDQPEDLNFAPKAIGIGPECSKVASLAGSAG